MIDLCSTKIQHIAAIVKLMKKERTKAPVIIIVDEDIKKALLKVPEYKRGPTEILFGEGITDVEVNTKITQTFNKKISESNWGCYLINRE